MSNQTQDPRAALFSQPIRQIVTMLVVVGLVCAGAWIIRATLIGILFTNLFINGIILAVFLLGIATCFWQVYILAQSVHWIEGFAGNEPGAMEAEAPTLLSPLAQLLKSRATARAQITSGSARSILDSVAQRIDEARDITRYLINTLVFLGLLGTFYGLATTIPAVVETIRSLAPAQGETGIDVFARLMGGLESQLGGMGTAFSSSLLGLAGSMIIGLLELFAGHGQSRFYRELEDWLSTITRLGFAGADGEGESAGVAAVLDHLSGQVEVLQTLFAQSEANRDADAAGLDRLNNAVEALTRRVELAQGATDATAGILARIAAGQEKMVELTAEGGTGGVDAESRMRLRSIDVQLLRILEEMAAGRQEGVADLKAEVANVSATLRQLARRS
jgi:hypothetical protein